MNNTEFRKLPGIDTIFLDDKIKNLNKKVGHELIKFSAQKILSEKRKQIMAGKAAPEINDLILEIVREVLSITESPLKAVINASGIVLHTNLGRAPFGKLIMKEIENSVTGYSNLEFNLREGKRGNRNSHVVRLLKYLTKAEDAIIVNNNAAAVMLILQTLAKNKEVIISRGEQIEIGGSFRIPDIMEASGAKMVEVGATNRTRISDYENAITEETIMLFKAHKSNYFIGGFTEEVEVEELSKLAKKHKIILVYDIGSGLIRRPKNLSIEDEPDVQSSLVQGADIVCFSGDKLLGGPQAGIIAGKKKYISQIARNPMMRALRVGKLTIAALIASLKQYLSDKTLVANNLTFNKLNLTNEELKLKAEKFFEVFNNKKIPAKIVQSTAQCGGGTLPHLTIKSFALQLILPEKKSFPEYQEIFFKKLLEIEKPILSILREGELLFDVLTIEESDYEFIVENIDILTRLIIR